MDLERNGKELNHKVQPAGQLLQLEAAMGQEGHLEVYLQGPYQTVVAALGLSRGEELFQRPNMLPLRKLRQPPNVAGNGQHIMH